jgi:hypothetical protein
LILLFMRPGAFPVFPQGVLTMMFNRSEIAAVHAAASRCDGVVTRTKSFFKKAGSSAALALATATSAFAQTSGSTAIDTTQLTSAVDGATIIAGMMAVGAVLALIYGAMLVIKKILDLVRRG